MIRIKFQSLQLFSILLSFLLPLFSCQSGPEKIVRLQPVTESFVHFLGKTPVTIKVTKYGEGELPLFLQLHHNETTAAEAVKDWLETEGGTLIHIENDKKRYISFVVNGRKYSFDPNRMFTKKGIRDNLSLLSRYHTAPAAEIEKFAQAVLDKLDSDTVISLHNNTHNNYSILSYQTDNWLRQSQSNLFRNAEMDIDDFFVTTNENLFSALKNRNYNAVLQNNFSADDGSLSVYLGKKGKTYVNIEAEHDHLDQQKLMISDLLEILAPATTAEY